MAMMVASVANATCQTSDYPCAAPLPYNTYDLVPGSNLPSAVASAISPGEAAWSGQCSGLPRLTNNAPVGSTFKFTVVYASVNLTSGKCSTTAGSTITVYGQAKGLNGVLTPCAFLESYQNMISHEIGHLLGLCDIPQTAPPGCQTDIMAQTNGDPHSITTEDCTDAETQYAKSMAASGGGGSGGGGVGTCGPEIPDCCYEFDPSCLGGGGGGGGGDGCDPSPCDYGVVKPGIPPPH
jgi:hypothetical protein